MLNRPWVVAVCVPGKEFQACSELRDDLGIEAFCPVITKMIKPRRIVSRKLVPVRAPMFMQYIFAKVGDDPWPRILQCRFVRGAVRFGGSIARMSDDAVGSYGNNYKKVSVSSIAEGDEVEVIYGPFKGIEGVYASGVVQVANEFGWLRIDIPVSLLNRINT